MRSAAEPCPARRFASLVAPTGLEPVRRSRPEILNLLRIPFRQGALARSLDQRAQSGSKFATRLVGGDRGPREHVSSRRRVLPEGGTAWCGSKVGFAGFEARAATYMPQFNACIMHYSTNLLPSESRFDDNGRMRPPLVAVSALTVAALAAVWTTTAHADESIIKNPGDHPDYRFEAEPHGLLGFGGPFVGNDANLGAGFRGTITILDNGFVKTINNSVGIGFGGDIFFRRGGTFFIPVVMQWNFWLTNHWSVFGEPGIGFAANAGNNNVVHFAGYGGGRYHFNDRVSLTMRLGYPAISVGVSFLL